MSLAKETHLTYPPKPFLAWLLLALLITLLVLFALLPALKKSHDLSAQIEQGYQQLVRIRQMAGMAPEMQQAYQQLRQQGLDQLFYPTSMTNAQVAKQMQDRLASTVAHRQGVVLSSEMIDDWSRNEQELIHGYQQVSVQVIFEGSMELLREVLHNMQNAQPLMFVDRLEVRPLRQVDSQALNASIQVSTYRQEEGDEVAY